MKNFDITGLQRAKMPSVKPNSAELQRGFSDKVKFPLWVFPETMESVERLADSDNCKSKSEFIEKAMKFYIGYLNGENNVSYLSPKITESVDAVVHGAERRISRNLFKIAVELGKLFHMVAAENEVGDETLKELHAMCVDEVRHINGLIDFESAVGFQQK